ncbi:MAG: nucleotide exchange factor GrpE [Dehalococcoidia bacterium]|nr:nucleotide exchange factor GrpE [Dehalococcoidia bacterium]
MPKNNRNQEDIENDKEPVSDETEELSGGEGLQKTLEAEKTRAQQYLYNWQRAEADLLNLKKRSEQEKQEAIRYGNSAMVLNLLSVMDDLERALEAAPSGTDDSGWVEGVKLIYKKLQTVMENQGVSPIKAVGENFDPALHEAVMYQEGEENRVLAEVRKGYRLNDRVIRASMVIIGKGLEKDAQIKSPLIPL